MNVDSQGIKIYCGGNAWILFYFFSSGPEVNIDNYDQPTQSSELKCFTRQSNWFSQTHIQQDDKETVKPTLTVKSC